MKRLQGFFLGFIVSLLVFSGIPNFADSLSVVLNSINLRVNGINVTGINEDMYLENGTSIPYSINYNGNIYLPLKKISELLNQTVTWDATTKTAIIGDNDTLNNQSQSITDNSRSNPAKLNQTVTYQTLNFEGKDFTLKITMTDLIRGHEAWRLMEDADPFNPLPPDEMELILAKFKVDVIDATVVDTQYGLWDFDFTLVSTDGKDYNYYTAKSPEPQLESKLYKGASNEGWVVFGVNKDDPNPLIVFSKNYDGTGGKWFYGY